MKYLPYTEPTILEILIQSSFLLLLNVIDRVLNDTIYCGLVGQIFLGVVWGDPLTALLGDAFQKTLTDLGYIGLILIVYEGGLNTSLDHLLSNIWLSSLVAFTGIILPIALSFLLTFIANATYLQCFAAGASLSSTSLGTTFTILSTAGLVSTRLGVVLTSAALIDDVVGLIIIQVVSTLNSGISAGTILRPILTSIGLVIVGSIGGWASLRFLSTHPWVRFFSKAETVICLQMLLLYDMVAAAGYAGASVLFAAFLSGILVSWWSQEMGVLIYQQFLSGVVEHLLKPFFFASIGFSIPITEMFIGNIVWKGMVFAILMTLGKLACGIWISPSLRRILPRSGNGDDFTVRQSLILGLGMVARGEIAFLIASIVRSKDVISDELFLIVTWATVLCTIIGPVGVGILIRAGKRQQEQLEES